MITASQGAYWLTMLHNPSMHKPAPDSHHFKTTKQLGSKRLISSVIWRPGHKVKLQVRKTVFLGGGEPVGSLVALGSSQ